MTDGPAPKDDVREALAAACTSWRNYARTLEDVQLALEESSPSRPAEDLVRRLERRARMDQIRIDLLLGEDNDEEGTADLLQSAVDQVRKRGM